MAGWTSINMKFENKKELFKNLDDIPGKTATRAMQDTMSDMRKRAPNIVAKDVTMRYNIKQGEVKPDSGGGGKISAGGSSFSMGGATLAEMTLHYEGRLLTPLHFNMGTTSGRIYKIKATILKGNRTVIGHHGPPYSEGGAYSRGSNSPYFITANSHGGGQKSLPFQREAGASKPSKVFKTVSIPQMVTNKFIEPAIEHDITKLAIDRLEHHVARYLK